MLTATSGEDTKSNLDSKQGSNKSRGGISDFQSLLSSSPLTYHRNKSLEQVMARISKMRRFRASPSRLTKVNKTLTQAQRQRVQNEGFGALLKFACSRIPAGHASWLMSDCFDSECSHLVLSGSGRVAVTANSVSRVLGLPNSGDQVKYEFMQSIHQ
ncbi:hypothetical protein BS78_10G164300 [Paspalum vaginatum]|nr:hypothetical protein BS78_10G164300 [Paspalum vaginatum]